MLSDPTTTSGHGNDDYDDNEDDNNQEEEGKMTKRWRIIFWIWGRSCITTCGCLHGNLMQ